MKHLAAAIVAVLGLALGAGVAHADFSKKVLKTFKGKILITDGELATQFDSDAALIAAYKKASKSVITGATTDGGSKTWNFHVMAFMKRTPGVRNVSLDFYRVEGKKKVYAANKRLSGLDPKLRLLSTRIELSEDDGLNAGRTYIVRLTAQRGKREVILAETKVTTK